MGDTIDVLVLGAGGAGLTAALTAATAGARVVVLEKSDKVGGTAAVSGGSCWLPGARVLQDGDQALTPDQVVAYLDAAGGGKVSHDRLRHFAQANGEVAAFVEEHSPIVWQSSDFPDYYDTPGAHPRGHGVEVVPFSATAALGDRFGELRVPLSSAGPLSCAEIMQLGGWGRFPERMDLAAVGEKAKAGFVAQGRGLVAGLFAGCVDAGVEFRLSSPVGALVTDPETGAVVGVQVGGTEVRAGAVVITTGGFEWDPALVASWLPGPGYVPASPPLNTGDGIKAAQALGAATGGTQEAWWFPVIHFPGEEWAPGAPYRRLTMAERSHPGSIMVNARGRRFVDEAASYHHVGRSFLAPDGSGMGYANSPAWLIFDARFRRSYRLSALAAGSEDPEWLDKADTLEALAERVGIDPAGLVAQVARFNEGAARGADDDFGRGTTDHDRACGDPFAPHPNLAPLTEAPFYAVPVLPGMLGTKGGLRTDQDGAVLHSGGGRIAGLFAAGNCTESVTGGAYPGPGGTLGPALVGGWCAGRAAARSVSRVG